MEELRRSHAFEDTIYAKKYGIQLLERWCNARGSLETQRIDILLLSRKEELLLDICHEGYPDCVRYFSDEEAPLTVL